MNFGIRLPLLVWWRTIDPCWTRQALFRTANAKSLTFPAKSRFTHGPMNNPTLEKMILVIAALLTSFALTAQSGSVMLSTARQTHAGKPISPIHRLLFPPDTYMIDDGSTEEAVGLIVGGDLIVLNEFAVIPGQETITQVKIAWGLPTSPDPTLDGLPYTVAIWSDPNGDGNPDDAQLLTTASGVVANQGTDTFITTDITPTTITTANFFVGFVITHATGQYPAALDETDPTFSDRSYVAGDTTPGNGNIMDLNDNELPVGTNESYGVIGNWLVRANTSSGGPNLTLAASKHRQAGNVIVSLAWNSTGSGRIDVLRNGVVIANTDDDGSVRDRLGPHTGKFFYQVCVANSSNCSNEVLVKVNPQGD